MKTQIIVLKKCDDTSKIVQNIPNHQPNEIIFSFASRQMCAVAVAAALWELLDIFGLPINQQETDIYHTYHSIKNTT